MSVAVRHTELSPPRPEGVGRRRRPLAPAILLGIAVVAWLIAVPSLRDAPWHLFGLLAAASPLFPISVALATIAFCLAIALRTTRTAVVAMIATVLMTRLPTAISTDAPLYSWTYKHFGPIDYIQRFGVVDVEIGRASCRERVYDDV